MTTERIKEIQSKTAYPESVSVQQALLQVWNECKQEQLPLRNVVKSLPQDNFCKVCNLPTNNEKCYSKRCPV